MEVRIEKLVYGGEGLAHHESQTVFVPLVLPGELVRVEPVSRSKKIIRGHVLDVVEPSPERVPGPCPHFGRCGGCQYQHMPYDAQLRYKAEILRETLRRLGRVHWDGPIATHGSPPFEYRNRAQWKVRKLADAASAAAATNTGDDAAANASSNGALSGIGYFEAGSTRLCPVQQCPILSPRLTQTLALLREQVAASASFAAIDEIEAFADAADDKILLNVSGERFAEPLSAVTGALREAVPHAESILVQDRRADSFELNGPGYIAYAARGANYRVGHLSFFQVNRFLIDALMDAIVSAAAAGESRGGLALDLFAGVGLFTVPLAARFDRVIGVESNLAAVKDLEFNLQASEGASLTARHATAEAFLERWRDTPDVVVLDPPRAGVDAAALARLKKLAPASILYLSCDPATLARDLALLLGDEKTPGPYQIAAINLFDIFPQTYHMEALVHLARRG